MSWLDLTSPSLQVHHKSWCALRGSRKVPHVTDYVTYVKTVPADFSASIIASEKRECTFKTIGENITPIFPGCIPGMPFSKIVPLPFRLSISGLFAEVIKGREPIVRRGAHGNGEFERFYEQIILPFIDARFDVRIILVLADGYDFRQREQ